MIIYGHRGAAGEAPENTLAGFAYAHSIGVRHYEFDVHLTRDGELAVIHDSSVARTTGGEGIAEAMTMAELRALPAYAKFPDWPERPGIPTLDEVFALIGQDRSFQVEIKQADPATYPRLVARLLAAVARYGLADRVYISSFDPIALQEARAQAPGIKRNYITNNPSDEFVETACRLECTLASPGVWNASAAFVAQLHAAGLQVCGWVGNDAATLDPLLAWGVDAITTDVPRFTLAYVREKLGGELE